MLRVTLYSGTILNNKYQLGFSLAKTGTPAKTWLERYLENKAPFTFDIDATYYENSGILNFDLELINNQNIYKYNYLKIQYYDEEENLKLTRYCFIDSIEIKNEIVNLYYSEDIFHSYANNIIGCGPSYLSRKRVSPLRYSPTFNLPVEYSGNNNIYYNSIETLTDEYYVITQIQTYTLNAQGEATERKSSYVLWGKMEGAIEEDFNTAFARGVFNFTKNSAILGDTSLITDLLYFSQKQYFTEYFNGSSYRYYEISNIHIIPKVFFNNFSNAMRQGTFGYIGYNTNNNVTRLYRCYEFLSSDKIKIYNKVITNNFKLLKIGSLTQNFDIISNGTDINLELFLYANKYAFDIYISLGNNLIKFTDSFKVYIPFTYLNGEIITQQKIQRQLATINGVVKIGTGVIETGLDIASYGGASGVSLFGNSGQKVTTKIKSKTKAGNTKWRSVSKNIPGKASALDIASDANFGLGKIATGITNLIEVNAPVYSTSKGIYVDAEGIFTIYNGLITININPDNEDYVEKSINNTGFVIYGIYEDDTFLKDMLFQDQSGIGAYYDVVKFEHINVYGEFPNDIANELNDILENGIKIIKQETIEQAQALDNYLEGILNV